MITQELLKKSLHYSSSTGIFTWKKLPVLNQVKEGDTAGCIDCTTGYVKIKLHGVTYKGHMLAILYMTGEWPKNFTDHKDHVRHNNKWSNLSQVTRAENSKNRTISKNNTSKVSGVGWVRSKNSWSARINVDGKRATLGQFKHKFDAICARKSAEIKYGYHENHGKPKPNNQ